MRPAGLRALCQAQLGHGWLKCALEKAGTPVTQVYGEGEQKQGEPLAAAGCTLDHGSPQARAAGAGQRPEGSKCFPPGSPGWHVSSLTSARRLSAALPGCLPPLLRCQPLPARRQPVLPGLGAAGWAAGRTSSRGPPATPAEQPASPRLPVSSACWSLCLSPGHLPGEFSRE